MSRKSVVKTKRPTRKKSPGKREFILYTTCMVLSLMLLGFTIFWYTHVYRQSHLLSIKINHASQTDKGIAVFQPEPNTHYVILDVSIVHHLSSAAWEAPVTESYIRDEQGHKYQMAPYALEHPFDARPYTPGATATGQLSYAVTNGAKNLKWCYALGALPAKCIPIKLN